ncbi:hypothetical protein [Acinetobacter ursingii]|uniref:hypothetical protein n=1 Tax=Acinetobacter ursingii TaxID=108980 RepID=UPI001D188276|nr:hypothetical protein [Acinetobacter ursingii]
MMMQVLLIFIFLLGFMFYTAYISQHQQISSGDFVLISTYIIQLTLPFFDGFAKPDAGEWQYCSAENLSTIF